MGLIAKISSSIQYAIYETPWTWSNVAQELISGQMDGQYLTQGIASASWTEHRLPSKWFRVASISIGYLRTIEKAQDPVFKNYIQWIRPLHYTTGALVVINSIIAWREQERQVVEHRDQQGLDRWAFKIWEYTPKILAIFNLYYALVTFRKRPIPSAVQIISMGITAAIRYFPKVSKVSLVWDHGFPIVASGFLVVQEPSLMSKISHLYNIAVHLRALSSPLESLVF